MAHLLIRTLIPLLTSLALVSGCGGSSTPQSEREAYGYSVAELRQAPNELSTSTGKMSLRAWAQATVLYIPDNSTFDYDPVTGASRWTSPGIGTSMPTWNVAAALLDSSGKATLTDWRPRTLWVVRENELVSTRNFDASSDYFGDAFPNPPFGSAGAVVVVEFVKGADTRVVTSPITWMP